MKEYKFCTHCRHKNRSGAKFCTQCGNRFKRVLIKSQTDNCPICYTARRSNAKFCRNCGYQFQADVAPLQHPDHDAIELPPHAAIPPLENNTPSQINPKLEKNPPPQGETAILISQEELGQLRRAKTGQIIFLPAIRRKKK